MNTSISTKFVALAVALFVNGLMFSSVAYLFDGQLHVREATASSMPDRGGSAALATI